MHDLTMGQRIAERRKLLNLSQEAFGEKMGVSRQAISKWEADGAVPEIDKLIAMSKFFGVSVDWLLGMNTETPEAEPRESFTEDQLKLVEEIVKRYQQPPKKNERNYSTFAIAALVFMLVSIAAAALLGNYVNNRLGSVWATVNQNYAYNAVIKKELEDLSSRLDSLSQGVQLLSEYSLEAVARDDMAGATIYFTAIPNRTEAGEQAWLSVRRDGVEVANAMCVMDGSAYTATVDLSPADGYTYYFQVVQTGGDSAQQKLTQVDSVCVDLLQALQGTVWCDMDGWGYSFEKGDFHTRFSVHRNEPLLYRENMKASWTQIDLVVLCNGAEVERKSYLNAFSDGVINEVDGISHVRYSDGVVIEYEYSGPKLQETDVLTLQLEYRFGDYPVSVQPVIAFRMENGEPKAESLCDTRPTQ